MLVLGIETSCDETGLALYETAHGLLAHQLYSQIDLHAIFGGVVPELASRDHVQRLLPLLINLLQQTHCQLSDITGIAYTAGPGLLGSLMVGACFAQGLAYALNIPMIGIHHLEGHLLAPMLEPTRPQYPFIALLVSGGHTQLVDIKQPGQYQLLGESIDDAAGEAFDKVAKMLDLPYPGGPAVAKLASQANYPLPFEFPRPLTDRPNCDFSFSGLKTHVLTTLKKLAAQQKLTDHNKAEVARAFEQAVIDTLIIKCARALHQQNYQQLVVAGGVSANQQLRQQLAIGLQKYGFTGQTFFPRLEFCTDNGAMIAYAGSLRLAAGQYDSEINLHTRWPLAELKPLNA